MTFMRTRVIGGERLAQRLDRMERAAATEVRQEITRGALAVEGTAKRLVQRGPNTGRIYEKYNPRRTHQASAPGEAPATDTGRLVSSIHAKIDADGFGADIEAATDYAVSLELGTSTTGARPFMQPALEHNRRSIVRRVRDALRKAYRKAARG